jgi:hypothetical protein
MRRFSRFVAVVALGLVLVVSSGGCRSNDTGVIEGAETSTSSP